jgi:hypothetical protein
MPRPNLPTARASLNQTDVAALERTGARCEPVGRVEPSQLRRHQPTDCEGAPDMNRRRLECPVPSKAPAAGAPFRSVVLPVTTARPRRIAIAAIITSAPSACAC